MPMGGAIEACSKRQVSTAIDTVGAELFVASTYAAVAIGLVNVLRFVSLLWRTRTPTSADVLRQRGMPTHLQRCDIDQESVIRHIWRAGRRLCVSSPSHLTRSCADAQGGRHSRAQPTPNPADAFTKHLTKPAFKPYACKIYFYNVHADHF